MRKAKIASVEQTETTALFSIVFEGEDESEFVKFQSKFINNAKLVEDLRLIINIIQKMLKKGFEERNFRYESKEKENVMALPVYGSRLRLYCLRMSESVLIVGNGGVKNSRTYQEDENLNGYVISLKELSKLLSADIKAGRVKLEEANLDGIDDLIYEI